MNATELHREWIDGESNGVRPRRVQRLRNDLRRETDHDIPRRRVEIEEWLEEHADDVAEQLADAADASEDTDDAAIDTDDELALE